MYYAGSILGVKAFGVLCWRRLPSGEIQKWWHVCIARCQDKSAAMTIELLRFLMRQNIESGKADGCSRLQCLSDTGTHFRSYMVMGTVANEFLRWLRPAFTEVSLFFGAESHFTNRYDGLLSQLRETLRQASMEEDVLSDACLVRVYRKWWDFRCEVDPGKWPASFHLFEPELQRHEVKLSMMVQSSLPASIMGLPQMDIQAE